MLKSGFLSLVAVLLLSLLPPAALRAQEGSPICFPGVAGIEHCISPSFAAYWRSNGGLPIFGYPISPADTTSLIEGQPILAQWSERNRMELHPNNAPDYRVQLGRIGAERLEQLGRNWSLEPREAGPQPGCLWFAETGRNVCNQEPGAGFMSYWQANGLRQPGLNAYQRSLALFGLPLTSAQLERGEDGVLRLTQWFERARFEWHPDNPARFQVLLGRLGHEVYAAAPSTAAPPWAGLSPFGVEINPNRVSTVAARISEAGFSWVRYNGILWNEIEARRGQRDWARLQNTERDLAAIAAQGGTTMLVVRGTPAWAQAVADKPCGPISPAALGDFAAFMGELVTRYSVPPYNVKYWELGNEPDAAYTILGGDAPFGCWGDERQPFYNGAAYAAMLQAVYPAIKAADPEAQVVFGGLLLDCEPGYTRFNGEPCLSGQFFEGVLRAGGGDSFDILAYHAYLYWYLERQEWEQRILQWTHRGGVLLGKRDFLVETLARYGYTKPLIMNEGGLLCAIPAKDCEALGFYTDQANYAIRMYTRTAASNLLGAVWYTLDGPGWQDGAMLDTRQQPRPAYSATRFLSEQLRGARYQERLGAGELEGYAFAAPGRTIQIYWTNDNSRVSVGLPPGTNAIYNMLGERLPLEQDAVSVGFEPLIIVAER
jgi:hypothetical protein